MVKLLLVEDEEKIRNGIKSIINWEVLGVDIYGEASNGYEALKLVSCETPDIILTDIKMPIMDGLQLIEELKKEVPGVKSIIMSGYDDFDYIQRAIKLGASDYLLKPSGVQEIQDTVKKVKKQILEEREREIYLQNLMKRFKELSNTHLSYDGFTVLNEVQKPMSMHRKKETIIDISRKIGIDIHSRKNISKILKEAIKFIEDNYYKDLNRRTVAEEVFITPSYLSFLFKKEMNITFIDYLHYIRIQRACELLKDIRYKTYDVAARVGYSDEKYFFQVFKKYKGMTPMQYRNNLLDI